jgi:DNA processing protein
VEETRTNDLPFWVALHRVRRLGRVRFGIFEAAFPSMEAAWAAGRDELIAGGLDARTATEVVKACAETDHDTEMAGLAAAGIRAIPHFHSAYPERLRVAVVGTRRATAYGRQAAGELSRSLAANRITIVSGLARGIDGIAHSAALEANGRTVAVVANGLDMTYPAEHAALADQIAEQGAVITDYPLGTQPRAEYFPRRNRIISGLTLGTLIVEGDYKSGAMITARLAMEQNGEVFAVPGSIFSPQSRGPVALLRDGATPVSKAEDVLEALNLTMIGAQMDFGRAAPPQNKEERSLMGALTRDPKHVDEIVRVSGLAASQVSATLALLELKGLVREVGAMQYVRVREESAEYDTSKSVSPA